MQGFKPKEFIDVLHKNGWKEVSRTSKGKGSHTNFKHPNYEIVITIPTGHKEELSRPLITRLIKQGHLIVNT